MLKTLKKNAMALVALAIAATSLTVMSFDKAATRALNPVTIYFHGDSEDPDQVADESRWNTNPNGQSCNDEDQLACSMEVDDSDLDGNQLDPSKISLGAQPTASGYIPTPTGGSSSTPFNPTNRD
ncbi:hypothetical protein FAZ19_10030 [Sphingobacterium alkalisoli]|uniref:Uncharacterized protein n=1 Tax=Sphingobacterium alkalisoli TaxID=1874115 RepID=A0A4U0H583_9SPHI|nr:hypothetical protein [Sphingobacterium alkalisoli]TJY65472.1 hypothetical protein FAZ19_10030 [Sphingobacterium alkalisoli]GGH20254.1 hypothetical protein GCM10011418_25300 [Sphingobacterium alkalisoli]